MRIRIAAGLALAALTIHTEARGAPSLPTMTAGLASCVNVRDMTPPATPNDSSDDDGPPIRAAISAAITSGKVVCFPGGTYDVKTKQSGSTAVFDLGSSASNLSLIGVGPGTVIKLSPGSAGGSTWYLFQLGNGAQHVFFRDLVLDGSGITSSPGAELLKIGMGDASGVTDVGLENVTIRSSTGWGVDIAGSTSTPNVKQIAFHACRFVNNTQDGILIRQGVEQVQVTSSYFSGNANIDLEVSFSGTNTTTTSNIVFADNLVVRDTSNGAIALYVYGYSASYVWNNVTIGNNIILNGRVHLRNVDRIALNGNLIIGGTQATSEAEVYVDQHADYVELAGNQLIRTSSTAYYVLSMSHYASVAPSKAIISGNLLVQPTANNVAQIASVGKLTFADNYLSYSGSATNTYGLVIRSDNNAVDYVSATGNTIDGGDSTSLSGAIIFQPTVSYGIGRIVVTDNVVRRCSYGVAFGSGTTFSTIPIVDNNMFDVTTGDISGLGNVPAIAIGGNVGGQVQLMGNGVPSTSGAVGSVSVGSTYVRRDGSPSLYVKETSTTWSSK